MENRLRGIYLVDSGGANLPQWPDVFPQDPFRPHLLHQATCRRRASRRIACVMGSCTRAAPIAGDER